MKKLIMAAIVCAATANVFGGGWCTLNFSTADGCTIKDAQGNLYSGTMTISCDALEVGYNVNVVDGVIADYCPGEVPYEAEENVTYAFMLTKDTGTHSYLETQSLTFIKDDMYYEFDGSGEWTEVVPEPTSGLLVLLGFVGLALKRKRA